MYIPEHYSETRSDALFDLIRQNSFGLLISSEPGDALQATHLPFLVVADRGAHGTLLTHMARANQHWRSLVDGCEVLTIFSGPHGYVSPSWYATAPAVPTWNYTAVHAYGKARLMTAEAETWRMLQALVECHEAGFEKPWSPDLPMDYRSGMLKAIVGVEIELTRLEGKLKLSQNRSEADREGVIAGLVAQGDPASAALAAWMRQRG